MKSSPFALAALIAWSSISSADAADGLLSLDSARALALDKQPSLQALELGARAAEEGAAAEGELPDPRLKFGALNLPTRNFPRGREDMTQFGMSYEQTVPGGDKRQLRVERGRAEAAQLRAELAGQREVIRRDVAIAWLAAWGAAQAERMLQGLQAEFRQAIDAATVAVGTGRGTQAEIFAARGLLNQSGDRLLELKAQGERARADLGRWIGEASHGALPEAPPAWPAPVPLGELVASLDAHPQHSSMLAAESTADTDVALAREYGRSDRSWEVGYYVREGQNRSDMLMFQLAFELPRQARQDRLLESRLKQRDRVREQRNDHLRQLRAELETGYSEWLRTGERLANFDARILPDTRSRIEAVLAAYQGGRTELTMVLEARRSYTEARLQRLTLEVTRAKARAGLEYFEHAH